tara:strand:- start:80 stop:232 length:153 start_codon:yes stop_codon:yes gene_type:complete
MAITLVGKLFIVNKVLCADKHTVIPATTGSYQELFSEKSCKKPPKIRKGY